MKQHKPNIILINADDLGYGDLGCYGSEVNDTPHIDAMAANGIRLTDFYMAAPLCSPSRGAMMTGCYPRRISFGTFEGREVLFPGQGVGLHPDEITIAKLLKTAGYRTMHIGKWHCGDQPEFLPLVHGFDGYYGLPYSNDMGPRPKKEHFPPLPLVHDNEVIEEQPDQATLTERYTEQAVRFLRESKDEPFFLYLAHLHVHVPHYAPERFLRESRNGKFGAALSCMDWSTGVILHELKALGLAEDTLVIFTSDNGGPDRPGSSNAPLRGFKGTAWEGGLRVPCVFYWPGTIEPGVCGGLASAIDLYPTLARLAGTEVPADRIVDGVDMKPLLSAEPQASNRGVFFYYSGDHLCAVRQGKWKLHVGRGNWIMSDYHPVCELYDLETDIGETTDVYTKYPDVADRLLALIEECRRDLGDAGTDAVGANVRPIGRVENPKPLTEFNPEHPYYVTMYDMEGSSI
jgi:arylsulfatase A-like enzyme